MKKRRCFRPLSLLLSMALLLSVCPLALVSFAEEDTSEEAPSYDASWNAAVGEDVTGALFTLCPNAVLNGDDVTVTVSVTDLHPGVRNFYGLQATLLFDAENAVLTTEAQDGMSLDCVVSAPDGWEAQDNLVKYDPEKPGVIEILIAAVSADATPVDAEHPLVLSFAFRLKDGATEAGFAIPHASVRSLDETVLGGVIGRGGFCTVRKKSYREIVSESVGEKNEDALLSVALEARSEGEDLTVRAYLTDFDEKLCDVYGVMFDLVYDAERLELTSRINGKTVDCVQKTPFGWEKEDNMTTLGEDGVIHVRFAGLPAAARPVNETQPLEFVFAFRLKEPFTEAGFAVVHQSVFALDTDMKKFPGRGGWTVAEKQEVIPPTYEEYWAAIVGIPNEDPAYTVSMQGVLGEEDIRLELTVEKITRTDLMGVRMVLRYDAERLELLSDLEEKASEVLLSVPDGWDAEDCVVACTSEGTVQLAFAGLYASSAPLTDGALAFGIRFRLKDGFEDAAFAVPHGSAKGLDGTYFPVLAANGGLLYASESVLPPPPPPAPEYAYRIDGEEVCILEYLGEGGDVTVPETVDGARVTSIGENAFAGRADVTSVTLPNGLKTIGENAFAGTGLTEVVLPDTVETVGEKAFADCTALESVTLNDGLKVLGKDAFLNTAITSLSIPGSVETIEAGAFEGYANLTSVTLGSGITAIGENAFAGTGLSEVVLPDTVEVIGEKAFADCAALESVTLNDGLKTVGKDAFVNTAITSLNIPGSVETIEAGAFEGYTNLTSVTLGSGITAIGENAFAGTGLSEVVLPDTVEVIGEKAFADCTALESVTLNDGLKVLGKDAFLNTAITSLNIPGSVETIEANAFEGYTNLTSVTLNEGTKVIGANAFANSGLKALHLPASVEVLGENPILGCAVEALTVAEENPVYGASGNCLFEKESGTLLFVGENAVLPTDGSVKVIGSYAFAGRDVGSELTLPDAVTELKAYAFAGCVGLEKMILHSGVERIGSCAFAECPDLKEIVTSRTEAPDSWAEDWLGDTSAEVPVWIPKRLVGDVNGDGEVDALDYMSVKAHVLRITVLHGDNEKAADINNDGDVDALDYMAVKSLILFGHI